jgi:CheY-like chemotaxis protein
VAVVLIVEDEVQVRTLAESILQEFGYGTRSAATMSEAQAIIASDDKIDVLFVDIALMDNHDAGLELAQAAVKLRPSPTF